MIWSVAFEEAIAWALARVPVLPDTFYDELPAQTRARAFTISGLSSLEQITRILDSLARATEDGQTFREWRKAVADEPELFELPAGRRETIFRNAIQTNYQAGYWQQIEDTKDTAPIIMYDAINDSRTRPTHAEMDGYMAHADAPIWDRWSPPNGHNCRCGIIQLSEEAASRRGWRGESPAPPVDPDPGWEGHPLRDYDGTLQSVVERAREGVAKRQGSLPPSFYGAVSMMLDGLEDALKSPRPVDLKIEKPAAGAEEMQ